MDEPLWRRRQLLYVGLGLLGTGATVVTGLKIRPGGMVSNISDNESVPNPRDMTRESVALAAPSAPALPEFQGISQWLNSEPLTVAGLKGRVVLVQFWTLGCINCQRTLPYLVR